VASVTTDSDLLPVVVLTYAYTEAGLLSSVAATIDGVADYVDEYPYDDDGNLVSISRHGVDGGNAVADVDVTLAYNSAGQLTTVNRYLDGVLAVTGAYTYDAAGLLTGLVYTQDETVLSLYTFSGVAFSLTSGPRPPAPLPQAGEGSCARNYPTTDALSSALMLLLSYAS
jgi:hypothetical protein